MSLQPPASRPRRWCFSRHPDRTGPGYWHTLILTEPRDAALTIPVRLACRLIDRHGHTCTARRDHQQPRRQIA